MKIKAPLLIVFEGIDGCGKSTQAKNLYTFCVKNDAKSVLLQEPTHSEYGNELRKIMRGDKEGLNEDLLELFMKDREYDVKMNILPHLQKGYVVIVDRYFYSTAAYQATDVLPPSEIIAMNIQRGFPLPDRVYLIDVEPQVALARIQKRSSKHRDIFETESNLKTIRNNYLTLVDDRFFVISSNKSEQETFASILHDFISHFSYA